MPIRRRIRSTSTSSAVISSPSMTIRPASIGSIRLMQRSSVDLPGARRADEADDLVLRDIQVDAAQDDERPERLLEALDLEGRDRASGDDVIGDLRRPAADRARSGTSVSRASGIVTTTNTSATAMYGVKLNAAACLICAVRKISTTPMDDTRTVSFCSPMKSFSSGGTTRRTACGTTTWRRLCQRLRPSERAAASWLGWTDSMPAR